MMKLQPYNTITFKMLIIILHYKISMFNLFKWIKFYFIIFCDISTFSKFSFYLDVKRSMIYLSMWLMLLVWKVQKWVLLLVKHWVSQISSTQNHWRHCGTNLLAKYMWISSINNRRIMREVAYRRGTTTDIES